MEFQIKPEDEPLIQAAIGMGDWLLAHPDTTKKQKQAIVLLQDGLRRLPTVTPGLDAAYWFEVVTGEHEPVGLFRSWEVSLSPPGILEIFSIYTPYPYPDDVQDKMQFELRFRLDAGQPNHGDVFYAGEWIAEVSSPEQFLQEGVSFEIEAEGKIEVEAELPTLLPSAALNPA